MAGIARSRGGAGLVLAGLGWGIAAGVALGALVLAPSIPGGIAPYAGGGDQDAENQQAVDEAKQREDAANELLAQESVSIVHGALTDVPVTIIRTSSADDADVESVRWLLNAAGASDSGQLILTERFYSQEAADELSTVIANTLPAGAKLSVDNRAPGTHAGESLATVLFTGEAAGSERASAADRSLVLEALQKAGFVDFRGSVVPAGAVVVVTRSMESMKPFEQTVVKDFVSALGDTGATVLATRDLDAPDVSNARSVGAVDSEAGRISAVLSVAK